MIATLIFTACLLANHAICKDVSPPLDDGLSCLKQGEIVVQSWLDEHPKWAMKDGTGWRCRYGVPEGKA